METHGNVSDRLAKGSCIMYDKRKEDQDLNEENSCVIQSKSSKLALNLNEVFSRLQFS